MKKSLLTLPITVIILAVAVACNNQKYTAIPADMRFGDWEVTRSSDLYSNPDSLWYLINPMMPQPDSIFYNGMYTDEYVHNDSARVVLIYDSAHGYLMNLKRMIAIDVNPQHFNLTAVDTAHIVRHLDMNLCDSSQNLYRVTPRAILDSLMMQSVRIYFKATTSLATDAAGNAQTYTFSLNTARFPQAKARLQSVSQK